MSTSRLEESLKMLITEDLIMFFKVEVFYLPDEMFALIVFVQLEKIA